MNQSTKISQRESVMEGAVGTTTEPVVHEESQEEQTVSPRQLNDARDSSPAGQGYEHSFGAAGFFKG